MELDKFRYMGQQAVASKSKIKSTSELHEPLDLTAEAREVFRKRSAASRMARQLADSGEGPVPIHDINIPLFNPNKLMPQLEKNNLSTLSLFSGGGGLDLGFDKSGFDHVGSWEILEDAGRTLRFNRPNWTVNSGPSGDVRDVSWEQFKGIDVIHGGPPCQPFSNAGKQRGSLDPRDMWPEFVRAVLEAKPKVFVAENVAALASATFSDYVEKAIISPLSKYYEIHNVMMQAYEYGVPQLRKRVVFFGFLNSKTANNWSQPTPTHTRPGDKRIGLLETMGVREALGLPEIGFDDVSPTIRSGLSGPRHTTSILSSVSAQKKFEALEVWPNGVAADREAANRFVVNNGHFRLSVPDVALLQGFPEDWNFVGATYMRLGQIGNSVAPPVGYNIAKSVAQALLK